MGLAERKLREGIDALKEGREDEARGLLEEAVRANPSSWKAWLWLSRAVEERERQRECLEKALEIKPRERLVQQELEAIGGLQEPVEETPSEPADILAETLLTHRRQAEVLEKLVDQQEQLLSSVNTIKSAAVVWLLLVGIAVLAGCILAATGSGWAF